MVTPAERAAIFAYAQAVVAKAPPMSAARRARLAAALTRSAARQARELAVAA